jgi:NADH dehydrogenase (ubiquinone) flavoprotein 1
MEKGDADKREIIPCWKRFPVRLRDRLSICALGGAAAWPVQGWLRHYKKDIEDRIDDPSSVDAEAAFQKSWSGDPFFDNADSAKEHGDGLPYADACQGLKLIPRYATRSSN